MKRIGVLILFCLFSCKEDHFICEYKKDTSSFPQNCPGVKKDVSVLWEFIHPSPPTLGPLLIGDLDGNGSTEVIGENEEMFYIVNGNNGKILWSYQTTEGMEFFGAEIFNCLYYVIGDVDCDKKDEIVALCANGDFYAFNGEDGSILWKASKPILPSSLGDIDGDGRSEIVGICGKEEGEPVGEFRICALNGKEASLLWGSKPIPSSVFNTISLGDLNGDKLPDVVLGCGHPDEMCGVIALNGKNGSLLWSYTYPEKEIGAVVTPPVLGDIDEDGKLEVIAVTYGHDIYAFNGEDGSLLWHHEDSPVGGDYYSIALAKVKGKFRIIGHGGVVLNEKGEVIFNRWYEARGPYYPIIGDANGDGKLDTIVYKVEIIFEDGKNYYQLKIYAVDIEDGSLYLLYEGEKKREVEDIRDFILADVNNDCILDILLSKEEWPTTQLTTTITALSLGVPVPPPHLLPWPMARHDVKNTGLYTGDPYPPW